MEINVLKLGSCETNCYLISTDKAAIVIDPGVYSETVLDFLKNNMEKERMILLTHAHFDHIGGADTLRNACNTKIGIGISENDGLSDVNKNLSNLFGVNISPFSADCFFYDGEIFTVGDIEFKIIETPGHTIGGVCYLTENFLFSGDTLFYGSVGRTDFPNSDFSLLKKSVQKLYKLKNETVVLSGHGPKTTIGYEKEHNCFIRGL